MKKFICFVAILLSFTLSSAVTMAGQGNDLPSGPRYMLNVIAFDNCPAGDFIGSNRHMIAVKANFDSYSDPSQPLTGTQAGKLASELIKTNTIALTPGIDFQVLDGNGCSNGGAEFMLPPNPYTCPVDDINCLNTDPTFQEYRVFVRLVGKPKTGIGVTSCATQTVTDPLTGVTEDIIVCSTETVVKVRMTGKNNQKFEDVSKELLTVCLDTDADGTCNIRYPLFAAQLFDYFWQWNTSGKAHAQLVFIPNPD
ncbi:MAG: hypothetical protein ACREQ2_19395 [Candidatus Binatia bacterium]